MTDSIGASPQAVQRAEVMTALRTASRSTGVDFDYLVKTAQRESNFDPSAKAPTSSATGLFQFTDAKPGSTSSSATAQSTASAPRGNRASDLLALRKDAELSRPHGGRARGRERQDPRQEARPPGDVR